MDPADAFTPNTSLFRWDPRVSPPPVHPALPAPSLPPSASSSSHHHHPSDVVVQQQQARDLTEVFQGYGIRYTTVVRIGELGFTASTLVGMRDEELDDMMSALSHLFRWDLLLAERYGIKAALRAERRRLEVFTLLAGDEGRRRLMLLSPDHPPAVDALSQEGGRTLDCFPVLG